MVDLYKLKAGNFEFIKFPTISYDVIMKRIETLNYNVTLKDNEVIKETGTNNAGKKNNSLALASFILGLVCFIIAGIPLGTAAVITGIISLTKFNPETEKNKWMAIVGIILGITGAVIAAVLVPQVLKNLNLQ